MPRGDGTGPAGYGPMTGRGSGYCAVFPAPSYGRNCGFGFGSGGGFGRRMFQGAGHPGFAHWGRTPDMFADEDDEKALLSRRAGILEKQLDLVKKRLSTLNKDA